MGRKSSEKPRKQDRTKTARWLPLLFKALQKRGLEGLTMDEVAGLLGKSKTTLYAYYRTKEALLADMLAWKLAEVAASLPRLEDPALPFDVRYKTAMGEAVAALADVDAGFLGELERLHPTLWVSVEQLMEQAVAALADFYAAGIKAGAFNDLSPALLSESDRYFFRLMTRPEWLHTKGLTVQQAFAGYLRMKFEGLLIS